MNTIKIIFKKELIDTLRDRRTLITMVALPLLLIPLLFSISSKLMTKQMKKAQAEVLKIGLIANDNAEQFREMLVNSENVKIIENISIERARALIQKDSLAGAFSFDQDFDKELMELKAGKVHVYYKTKERQSITKMRLLELIKGFEKKLMSTRLKKLGFQQSIVNTVKLYEINIATPKERVGQIIGGFLPYLFILFCFLGCMYPAIDLGAGEKERGTLETLMTSPANRLHILIGKFGVVVLTGVMSAIISMIGMYVGIKQMTEIPPELLGAMLSILELHSIVLVLSLLVPLTIFFAGIELSLSIYAKSFKEAQSIISPLTLVVILPAFIGLLPGMVLNKTTALIPILNVSLASKDILSGTVNSVLLAEVYLSMFLLAGISLYFCSKWFAREETIFRL